MKNITAAVVLVAILLAVGYGYMYYRSIYLPNVTEQGDQMSIYIYPDASPQRIKQQLIELKTLRRPQDFDRIARLMNWDEAELQTGHYILSKEMTNRAIINMFKAGNQQPVKVVVQNVRTLAEFCGKVSDQLFLDSVQILNHFQSAVFLKKYDLRDEEIMTFFIPNTYEFYWTVTLPDFEKRMHKEGEKYWTEEKRNQADALGLSAKEVYILASIVEKESNASEEMSTIAGLYLNRLNIGMPLQADPTVVFATKNFETRRVLNKHLAVESPYNTYKYQGLPPGPICMPSLRCLEATLNAEKHNYLFMCAKPDNSGTHAFASNIKDHNRNAQAYHRWLNLKGIK